LFKALLSAVKSVYVAGRGACRISPGYLLDNYFALSWSKLGGPAAIVILLRQVSKQTSDRTLALRVMARSLYLHFGALQNGKWTKTRCAQTTFISDPFSESTKCCVRAGNSKAASRATPPHQASQLN
jgi:hypothetical protein